MGTESKDCLRGEIDVVRQVSGKVVGAELVFRIQPFLFQIFRPASENRPVSRSKARVPLGNRNAGNHQKHVPALLDRHLIGLCLLPAAVDLSVRVRVRPQIVRSESEFPSGKFGVFKQGCQLCLEEGWIEQQEQR